MATSWQKGAIFASGLALGAAAAAWLVLTRDDGPAAPSSTSSTSSSVGAATAPTAPDTRVAGAAGGISCAFNPAVPKAGDDDGRASLPAKVEGKPASEAAQLLVTGKEDAAAGRMRDAEVVFITSCRVAEGLGQEGELPLAEAKYNLARHYRVAALAASGGSTRSELLRRAEGLYADALATYRDRHGAEHEKTRFAAQGLENVRQAAGGPAPAPVAAAKPQAVKPPAPVAAARPATPAPAPAAPVAAASPAPKSAAPAPAPQARVATPTPAPAAVDEQAAARAARRQEAERLAQAERDRVQREAQDARRQEREAQQARRVEREERQARAARREERRREEDLAPVVRSDDPPLGEPPRVVRNEERRRPPLERSAPAPVVPSAPEPLPPGQASGTATGSPDAPEE